MEGQVPDSTIYLGEPKRRRRPPMSRYTITMLALLIADVVLVLFLTFGAVFPSRLSVPDPNQPMPDNFYDFTAKTSPFSGARKVAPRRASIAPSGNGVRQAPTMQASTRPAGFSAGQ